MAEMEEEKKKEKAYKIRTRLTAADIAALVRELRGSVRGMRVVNVFECEPTTYSPRSLALKLSGSSAAAAAATAEDCDVGDDDDKLGRDSNKALLVVDPPARIHTTRHTRPRRATPTALALKLRKHLRGKRLEAIEQLGADRVVDMRFGVGASCVHLIVELYAQGNICLAEGPELQTLAVLRRHDYAEGAGQVAVHAAYPLGQIKRLPTQSPDELVAAASAALQRCATARDAARSVADVGAHLVEHALAVAGIDPAAPASSVSAQTLAAALGAAYAEAFNPTAVGPLPERSLLLLRPGEGPKETRYYDFVPRRYAHLAAVEDCIEMPSFDAALDEFFTSLESAQAERQRVSQEAVVARKLAKLESDQRERLATFEHSATAAESGARLVETNLALVDRVISELRAAVASGLPWPEIEALIKQQRRTDPTSIARHVDSLNLKAHRVTLLLRHDSSGANGEEEEKTAATAAADKPQKVEIDFEMTAHGNVERLFQERTQWLDKARKTAAVAEDVLQRAKAKYERDAKARASASAVAAAGAAAFAQTRKRFWFEHFHWFISSENFVVVSGRDMHQNEQLYRRHLRVGDIYVHADFHGAATTIIKNPRRLPIGAATLEQAGRCAMCRSSAWASKTVTSAYWVYPSQVSKSAPTGEYLTTGSFMIRGKKNILPPHPLVMGFGILFALDPVSIPAHLGERKPPESENAAVADTSLAASAAASAMAAPVEREEDWESMAESIISEAPAEAAADIASMSKEVADDKKPKSKPRLSAHDRRQAKKSGEVTTTTTPATPPKVATPTAAAAAPKKKLSKAKQRKLKKYEDQDEEERAMRMALIGHAPKQPSNKKEAEEEKKQKQQQTTASSSPAPDRRCFFCGSTEHYARTCPLKQKQQLEEDEKRRQERFRQQATPTADVEEDEDDDNESDEEDKATKGGSSAEAVAEVDKLTGQPRPEDVLLFAVPVCAPFDALQSYKYKVKITPGNLKRSKAVESALQIFLRQPDITEQEKRLIQAIPNDEMLQCILGDVKIAGGQAAARLASLKAKKSGEKKKH